LLYSCYTQCAMTTRKVMNDSSFFKYVLESIEDYAVFTTNKEGLINSWNVGSEQLLGYTEEEITGKNASILFVKNDVKKGEHLKELRVALKQGSALDERYHQRKDGSQFWASGKVFPLHDDDHRHIGFTKIMRNLDERRLAEEQLNRVRHYAESIVESAAEPIIILNEDRTVNTLNQPFRKLFKITKKNIAGLSLQLLKGDFDSSAFLNLLADLKEGEEGILNVEFLHRFKSGEISTLLVNGRKLRPDSKITLVMVSIQDITQQRALEKQKDDFICIASHEIKTPLTVIKSTAQLLQRHADPFTVEKFAQKIGEKTDKLLTLLKYLLDVSQVSNNEFRLAPEWFSLKQLVDESVDETLLINPGLTVIVKSNIKTTEVWADRFRISQVLNNFLNNAVKYSPVEKKIIVRLSENKQANQIVLSVQDFGVGIPKDEQKNLFKRFWRASTARNVSGIGLGLYISSQIIKRHNGKIWFTSDRNKGSTFKFSIPVKSAKN